MGSKTIFSAVNHNPSDNSPDNNTDKSNSRAAGQAKLESNVSKALDLAGRMFSNLAPPEVNKDGIDGASVENVENVQLPIAEKHLKSSSIIHNNIPLPIEKRPVNLPPVRPLEAQNQAKFKVENQLVYGPLKRLHSMNPGAFSRLSRVNDGPAATYFVQYYDSGERPVFVGETHLREDLSLKEARLASATTKGGRRVARETSRARLGQRGGSSHIKNESTSNLDGPTREARRDQRAAWIKFVKEGGLEKYIDIRVNYFKIRIFF